MPLVAKSMPLVAKMLTFRMQHCFLKKRALWILLTPPPPPASISFTWVIKSGGANLTKVFGHF